MSLTIYQIINVIQLIIFIPLALAVIYIFVYSFAGIFYRQRPYPANPRLKKICVVEPGYQED